MSSFCCFLVWKVAAVLFVACLHCSTGSAVGDTSRGSGSDVATPDDSQPRNDQSTSSSHDNMQRNVSIDVASQSPAPIDLAQFQIMPLGDSISICCNYCAVPAAVLTRKDLAEPATPWDGYIRALWKKLKEEEMLQQVDIRRSGDDKFRFTYVGRVRTCMVNRSETMRVLDDWEIRYEGYYGYTTGRVLKEIVEPALRANDPDVVLLMLGTNDLIQAKSGKVGQSRVGGAIQNLRRIVDMLLTTPRSDPKKFGYSRMVFIAKIPPIWFQQIKAVPPAARKPHRVVNLNLEIDKLVASVVSGQQVRFNTLRQAAGDAAASHSATFTPTLGVVDMFSNFSTKTDLHGDGLHPNHLGELKISQQWLKALAPLMEDPHRYRTIPMAQNSEELLAPFVGAANAKGSSSELTVKSIALPARVVTREPSEQEMVFGHPPGMSLDAALVPVVVVTVLVYAVAVCRPTHRWIRLAYGKIASSLLAPQQPLRRATE